MSIKNNLNITTLETAIELDIVTFTFTKLNGSTRIARGTRNLALIPESAHPKGTGGPGPEDSLIFYDYSKKQWRSCKRESIFGDWKILPEDLEIRVEL